MQHTLIALTLFAQAAVLDGALSRYHRYDRDVAWFYNLPGSTPAQVTEDLSECQGFARDLTARENSRGFLADEMDRAAGELAARGHVDDCMIARGYRRFDVQGETQEALDARLGQMSNSDHAAILSSETPPIGVLARSWANTHWLSRDGDPAPAHRRYLEVSERQWGLPPRIWQSREPEGPIHLGPGDALVVGEMRVVGPGLRRSGLSFERYDPVTGSPSGVPHGRRGRVVWPSFGFDPDRQSRSGSSDVVIQRTFVVPAGTYALAFAFVGDRSAWFCMGTVSFTVEPGMAVYLGEFTVQPRAGGEGRDYTTLVQMRVDPRDLEVARARLSHAPDIAERLQPVVWQNGFPMGCPQGFHLVDGLYIYGFDIPGAAWRSAEPASQN